MKRLLLIAGAALAAATFVPLAGGGGSSYDYVVGAGERATDDGVPINHFSVSAQDGPVGVFGQYQRHSIGLTNELTVDVTCTYIAGNRAMIGGVIRKAVNVFPELEGIGFAVAFEDNGNPAAGVTPDRVSSFDFFAEPGRTPPMTQADCASEVESSGIFNTFHPMASGNVEIYDAP
jgi:hypothetical protein